MKFLREPLVQFLLLGAALFGIFAAVGKSTSEIPNRVVVAPGMVENLKVSFERNAQRPPTPTELDALIADYVREEILCREAIARGLDRDDPTIRRELRRKMEFLAEDDANQAPPADDQLQDFMNAHSERFARNGAVPPLSAIRDGVARAWADEQRKQALDAAYSKLREHYVVEIQKPAEKK